MRGEEKIISKLNELKDRYEEVTTLIASPTVIADQQRYTRLTKEYKELEQIVKVRAEYLRLTADLEEYRHILASKEDPEIKELAKEEIPVCEQRLGELEEEIKLLLVPKDPEDAKMRFSKFGQEPGATKLPCSPATCSACTPDMRNARTGTYR